MHLIEYTNISNEFQRNQENILHLINEINNTFSWDDLPDFTNPQTLSFSFSITGILLLMGIIFIECCCMCPGPCLHCCKVMCCGRIREFLDRKYLVQQLKKEKRKQEEQRLDRIAESRRTGVRVGNIVKRSESVLSSQSYLPAGDIQRVINGFQDKVNNLQA